MEDAPVITQRTQYSTLWEPRGVGWGRGVGDQFQEGAEYVCLWLIHVVV